MNAAIDDTKLAMQRILEQQKAAFIRDGAVSASTRIDRLKRLNNMVGKNQTLIFDACHKDFGCHSRHQAQMSEVGAVMSGVQDAVKQLPKWMKHEKRKPMFPLGFMGAKARIEWVPKGVVGILSTWNFPVYTALSPLIGIFAAGNRAMLKMSEVAPAAAALIKQIAAQEFDETELAVINGGPDIGAAFSGLPLDHLIFTGSPGIGKQVMRACADNLTPCTLELGGKSPVIVSSTYDIEKAAQRIFTGKALNTGQACLAPDYVFVPTAKVEAFCKAAIEHISALFPRVIDNNDYTSVVNESHYSRVKRYVDDARARGGDVREINPAREDFSNQPPGIHKIPMTLVIDPSDEFLCMQEEIFGPVLSVKSYSNIDECINYINAHPRPLGLYYFGNDAREERKVLDNTISGGVSINDVMAHPSSDDLPFGGIGNSGMGNYHGQDGFRTFSHPRAVFKQTALELMKLSGMLPPYGEKCEKQLNKMTKV
jgi:coniferyl-aldehyde dehydrogenase